MSLTSVYTVHGHAGSSTRDHLRNYTSKQIRKANNQIITSLINI